MGDADADGLCDRVDLCFGDNSFGDTDGDGLCEDLDQCAGIDTTGDPDGDGVCSSNDLCPDDLGVQCGNLPDPADYDHAWFVATHGDDTAGDGSSNAPYRTLQAAVASAVSGDAIVLLPGTHRLIPWSADSAGAVGVFDDGKGLHIWGGNERTVLQAYGFDAEGIRDYNLFSLTHNDTVVSNLSIDFAPNRSTNYANSLFRNPAPTATVRNIHVRNVGRSSWSYNYDNSNRGGPLVYNSVFDSDGRSIGNYSGSGQWRSILWDIQSSSGTRVGNRIRSVDAPTDLFESSIPLDLQNAGDPSVLNTDGNTSHIGTAGGMYSWE